LPLCGGLGFNFAGLGSVSRSIRVFLPGLVFMVAGLWAGTTVGWALPGAPCTRSPPLLQTGSPPTAAPPSPVILPKPLDPRAADIPIADESQRTPLAEDEAATRLAQAWRAVMGDAPSSRTLAILWAHWAHETARGQRMFGHNFGGIKGKAPDGSSLLAWTRESEGDTEVLALRAFRAYSGVRQGALDYVRLLERRYPVALQAARAGDPSGFADALAARGYASDDAIVYRRALASLSNECLSRSISSLAIDRLADVR
jgi:hypothetical protein